MIAFGEEHCIRIYVLQQVKPPGLSVKALVMIASAIVVTQMYFQTSVTAEHFAHQSSPGFPGLLRHNVQMRQVKCVRHSRLEECLVFLPARDQVFVMGSGVGWYISSDFLLDGFRKWH
jgi:hypothetical protein